MRFRAEKGSAPGANPRNWNQFLDKKGNCGITLDKVKKGPVRFIKSAVNIEDYPPADLPEIAFIGRSNAGKSSLINTLFGRTIAKVSNTPGKTTLLNFFALGEDYRFVDMPGYGYASRSGQQVRSWKKMIETYFSCRANLRGAVLVMDIRRGWEEDEAWLVDWLTSLNVPCVVAMTKTDKLNRAERERKLREMKRIVDGEFLFCTSTADLKSVEALRGFLMREWLRARPGGLSGAGAEK